VPRDFLLARLDEGLDHKLTLVSASAGFGKTTLVSQWLASPGERQDPPPVAWVSLDEGDHALFAWTMPQPSFSPWIAATRRCSWEAREAARRLKLL
jgi:hypothetical protein